MCSSSTEQFLCLPGQPALGNLFWQGGWTRWSLEVPSNPYSSVILWFCDSVILWFCDSVILWFCDSVILWFCDRSMLVTVIPSQLICRRLQVLSLLPSQCYLSQGILQGLLQAGDVFPFLPFRNNNNPYIINCLFYNFLLQGLHFFGVFFFLLCLCLISFNLKVRY